MALLTILCVRFLDDFVDNFSPGFLDDFVDNFLRLYLFCCICSTKFVHAVQKSVGARGSPQKPAEAQDLFKNFYDFIRQALLTIFRAAF